MATLTPAFHSECVRINSEHRVVLEDLAELERGLNHLVCHSEVFTDLSGLEQVRRAGLRLAEFLPVHCRREEDRLLATVAVVSPELSEFAREMKGQHRGLLSRLLAFCAALDAVENSADLRQAVWQLQREGTDLTEQIRQHVALEEQELSGFL